MLVKGCSVGSFFLGRNTARFTSDSHSPFLPAGRSNFFNSKTYSQVTYMVGKTDFGARLSKCEFQLHHSL